MGNSDLVIQILPTVSWMSYNILILGIDYINREDAINKALDSWKEYKKSSIERISIYVKDSPQDSFSQGREELNQVKFAEIAKIEIFQVDSQYIKK